MRFVCIVLLILISGSIYSQKRVDAILIKKGSADSLYVKIKQPRRSVDLSRQIIVIDTGDKTWPEEKWIKPKEIDYIEFTDFKGEKRIFVTQNHKGPLKKLDTFNIYFFEELFVGKISWYRMHSRGGIYGNYLETHDCFLKEGKRKPDFVSLFKTHKKILIKLMKDMPDLEMKIDTLKDDKNILEILEIYNSRPNDDKTHI